MCTVLKIGEYHVMCLDQSCASKNILWIIIMQGIIRVLCKYLTFEYDQVCGSSIIVIAG